MKYSVTHWKRALPPPPYIIDINARLQDFGAPRPHPLPFFFALFKPPLLIPEHEPVYISHKVPVPLSPSLHTVKVPTARHPNVDHEVYLSSLLLSTSAIAIAVFVIVMVPKLRNGFPDDRVRDANRRGMHEEADDGSG